MECEFTLLPSKEYTENGILTQSDIDFINEIDSECDTCPLNHENQAQEEKSQCLDCSGRMSDTCFKYYPTEAIEYALTLKKRTDVDIPAVKKRILKDRKDNTYLLERYMFFFPETFWNEAKKLNLCTQEEYDEAKKYYGDRWDYASVY